MDTRLSSQRSLGYDRPTVPVGSLPMDVTMDGTRPADRSTRGESPQVGSTRDGSTRDGSTPTGSPRARESALPGEHGRPAGSARIGDAERKPTPPSGPCARGPREAERQGQVSAADRALGSAVDSLLRAIDDRHAIQLAARPAALRQAAAGAVEHDKCLDAWADELRRDHHIPDDRITKNGHHVDGWFAKSDGYARRVGLLVQDELLVQTSLRQIARNAGVSESICRGFEAAEATYHRCDRALVLAIAARETRGQVFRSTEGSVNTFHQGGLDSLGKSLRDPSLFSRHEVQRWRATEHGATNEQGRPVHAVTIPRSEQIRAYAGVVEERTRRFEAEVCAQFGEAEGRRMLGSLSDSARRMWIQIAFGGPYGQTYRGTDVTYGGGFGLRTAIGRLVERAGAGPVDLDAITAPDEFLDQFTRVRRARVTAAEAELFERSLGEDLGTWEDR